MDKTRTLGLAAEAAFWLFLSLVPLAAAAGLLAARFSLDNWNDVVPLLASLPGPTRQLVSEELTRVAAWNGGTVGAVASLTFLWLASSGVHALFDTLEVQAGGTRPWWRKRLAAIATCFAFSALVVVLATLTLGLQGALAPWAPDVVGRIVRVMVGLAVVFGYVCGLYWIGIPADVRGGMPIVPGALVTVALEACFGFAYTAYLSTIGDGSAYSAGLAIIGVTLMGLYLFVVALLVGALVNRRIGARRKARTEKAMETNGRASHTEAPPLTLAGTSAGGN